MKLEDRRWTGWVLHLAIRQIYCVNKKKVFQKVLYCRLILMESLFGLFKFSIFNPDVLYGNADISLVKQLLSGL